MMRLALVSVGEVKMYINIAVHKITPQDKFNVSSRSLFYTAL
jgi:hypothetical protein